MLYRALHPGKDVLNLPLNWATNRTGYLWLRPTTRRGDALREKAKSRGKRLKGRVLLFLRTLQIYQ